MSYTITSQCIECDRCLSVCPTNAIQHHWIDPTRCNNCADSYSVAQCAAACPTNYGCVPGTTAAVSVPSDEYWNRWFTTYQRLIFKLNDQTSPYWHDWFDLYSERLSTLLSQNSGTRNANLHLSR
ncbi:4Fe-4S dicluster domain-containing protein [Leptolyngbya sp. AN03gr2]|uniref:4Fe-4S dicluster domain-containing protein n=1 Tax=unclassified Leptolyngbya TaxID=2650499 RepID=UPI003D323D26